jgi:hypothetical protein
LPCPGPLRTGRAGFPRTAAQAGPVGRCRLGCLLGLVSSTAWCCRWHSACTRRRLVRSSVPPSRRCTKWCLCSGFMDAENQAAQSRTLSGSYSAPKISGCLHSELTRPPPTTSSSSSANYYQPPPRVTPPRPPSAGRRRRQEECRFREIMSTRSPATCDVAGREQRVGGSLPGDHEQSARFCAHEVSARDRAAWAVAAPRRASRLGDL